MKVAVCRRPGDIVVEQLPEEQLRPQDVLIKIGYCGVCPWDLRAFAGLSSSVHYPLQLGHEIAGVIDKVGEEVRGFAPGDRVVPDVIRRCGTCSACRHGFENHCEHADFSRGGYAERIVVPASNVYHLRDATPLMEAALAEPLACILRGQNRIGIGNGDVVFVSGCGPLGLLHLQLARARGAVVIASDPLEYRREMAQRLGAELVVNPERDDLAGLVKAHTGGYGVDAAIVANGQAVAVRQALPLLGWGGRLLLFAGVYPKAELPMDPNAIHYGELLITGSSDYTQREFAKALDLIEDGALQIAPLISHVYSLDEIGQALVAPKESGTFKSIVVCDSTAISQSKGEA